MDSQIDIQLLDRCSPEVYVVNIDPTCEPLHAALRKTTTTPPRYRNAPALIERFDVIELSPFRFASYLFLTETKKGERQNMRYDAVSHLRGS